MTMGLIAALIIVTVGDILDQHKLMHLFAFGPRWMDAPWTLLVYPFYDLIFDGLTLLFFVFLIFWMVWVVAPTEREIGTLKFAVLWVIFTVLPPLLIYFGANALRCPFPDIYSPELPLAGMTFIWCLRNRTAQIRLFAVLPITGIWLAAFTVAVVFITHCQPNLLLGVLACVHLGLAYLVAENRIPWFAYSRPFYHYVPSKTARVKEERYRDDVYNREKERQERERLRKLFESSIDDEK